MRYMYVKINKIDLLIIDIKPIFIELSRCILFCSNNTMAVAKSFQPGI